jgi:hypothetical protein
MIDPLLSFRFRFCSVVVLQNTTIDALCQRRAERESEAARAFHRRAVVHRFRQLLSDPRRAAGRAREKAAAIADAGAIHAGPMIAERSARSLR